MTGFLINATSTVELPRQVLDEAVAGSAVTVVTQIQLPVTITGWLTTVWNGEPRYSITDDQGKTTTLLLDEELAKPLGGPLALDRKRVILSGKMVNEAQGVVRVLTIRFDGGR